MGSELECVKAIFWTWHSVANILYCLQISNKFLALYSFDTRRGNKNIPNDFEENKFITDHSCLVKSNR